MGWYQRRVHGDSDEEKTKPATSMEESDPSSQDEANKKEEESRPTRSKLHVDTIGLSSSTLDLELHALRNLVFKEILESTPEEISLPIESEEDVVENISDQPEESEKPENVVHPPPPTEEPEEIDDPDYPEIPDDERFTI